MKIFVFLLAAMMMASCSDAQKLSEKDVPEAVKSAFNQKYPNAGKTAWEMENGNYEAEFEVSEVENSVVMDASGNMLELEVEINVDALPENVKTYVKEKYASQKIKEAAKITNANGTITYEAEIKGMDLLFDASGNFIKEEKE